MNIDSASGRRAFLIWGGGALALALAEYPFARLVNGLIGPALQPYPTPSLTYGNKGDVYANLAIPAAGMLYQIMWLCLFAVIGGALKSEIRGAVWLGSWLISLGVVVHSALHYAAPWLLVITDTVGITTAAAASPPPYLNVFQPSAGRLVELPLLVAVVFVWSYRAWQKKRSVWEDDYRRGPGIDARPR